MKTDIKNQIANTLFELLKTKELNEINIVELSLKTGISRTTFYNNFKNIKDVLDYKFINVIKHIKNIIMLNNIRKNNSKKLLKEILNYISQNKNTFIIIKNKLFFEFKKYLDNNISNNTYDYYIKSGIIINLCLLYIENNFYLDLDKIKID